VISFMPWLLYPQAKSPEYPLDRRLGGSWNQSGYNDETSPCPYQEPNPGHPASSLDTILTELSQLL